MYMKKIVCYQITFEPGKGNSMKAERVRVTNRKTLVLSSRNQFYPKQSVTDNTAYIILFLLTEAKIKY